MKIKIVVRPEDAQAADAAAESARRVRQRRARWGLAALLGLVALSAASVFFFVGRERSPAGREEQPAATALPPPEIAAEQAPSAGTAGMAPPAEVADDTSAPAPEAGGDGSEATPSPPPAEEEQAERQAPSAPATPREGSSGKVPAVTLPVAPPAASTPSPAAPEEAGKAPVVARVPAKPDAGVVRAQLALRVIDREPGEPLQSPVNVGAGDRTVYYFTEFRNLSGQTVTHRWEYDGRVMASIPFRIEGNRWRVYSSKRIGENQRGPWRVTTVDKAGTVLARAEFSAQ